MNKKNSNDQSLDCNSQSSKEHNLSLQSTLDALENSSSDHDETADPKVPKPKNVSRRVSYNFINNQPKGMLLYMWFTYVYAFLYI